MTSTFRVTYIVLPFNIKRERHGHLFQGRFKAVLVDADARDLTGMGGKEPGEVFWDVSGAAITMRHKAVSEKTRNNKRLKGRINRLTKQIINIEDAAPLFPDWIPPVLTYKFDVLTL